MNKLKRTTSNDLDFLKLVALLDADLKILDGADHAFFAQFNKLDKIKNVVVYYIDDIPAGGGAFKEYEKSVAEIKRMFVKPEFRNKGIAADILKELEKWAKELNFSECILETTRRQPAAIRLYEKSGYTQIPNYGQYEKVESSFCMKKLI